MHLTVTGFLCCAHHVLFHINKLSRHDIALWKPIKSARKPKLANPPIRRQTPTVTHWAKRDKHKADLFGDHLATVFTPHSDDPDPELIGYWIQYPIKIKIQTY
jgi:hypothetical protein